MRLLIDEMYPPAIAEQLRRLGHEVDAVTAQAELRALSDPDLFKAAQDQRRAMVTENLADFISLADGNDHRGRAHHGLVLVDPAKYPRGNARTIGRVVTALDRLLRATHGEEPASVRHWL
ncbi:MAG: DUF5615 family PIN-like protein [Thermoleophilaceae bacterium]